MTAASGTALARPGTAFRRAAAEAAMSASAAAATARAAFSTTHSKSNTNTNSGNIGARGSSSAAVVSSTVTGAGAKNVGSSEYASASDFDNVYGDGGDGDGAGDGGLSSGGARALTPSMVAIRVLNAMAAILPPASNASAGPSPTANTSNTSAEAEANDDELRAFLASPLCPTNVMSSSVNPVTTTDALFDAALAPSHSSANTSSSTSSDSSSGSSSSSGSGSSSSSSRSAVAVSSLLSSWDPSSLPPRVSHRVWAFPRLYLDRLHLDDLSTLDLCTRTTHLYLQHNRVPSDLPESALAHLAPTLRLLSLASNGLTAVPPAVGALRRLKVLDLRDNNIAFESLMGAEIPDSVQHLWLSGNPCVHGPSDRAQLGYRAVVVGSMPRLRSLDGVAVSARERAEADARAEAAGSATDDGDDDADDDDDDDGGIDNADDLDDENEDDDDDYDEEGNPISTSASKGLVGKGFDPLEEEVLQMIAARTLYRDTSSNNDSNAVTDDPYLTATAPVSAGAAGAGKSRLDLLTASLLDKSLARSSALQQQRSERERALADWKQTKMKELEDAIAQRGSADRNGDGDGDGEIGPEDENELRQLQRDLEEDEREEREDAARAAKSNM